MTKAKGTALPPNVAAYRLIVRTYRLSARRKGLEFTLSDSEIKNLLDGNCRYCGSEPCGISKKGLKGSYTYSGIDRVDNTLGYVGGNVVSCCKQCNMAKGVMTEDQFMLKIQAFALTRRMRLTSLNILYNIQQPYIGPLICQ